MRQRAMTPHRGNRVSAELAPLLFQLGYDVLGPAFTYFTLRLQRRLADLEIDAVYFLARDGFLLQQLFRVVGERRPRDVAVEYACVSRLSSSLPSLRRFGMRELRLGAPEPQRRSLTSALQSFGLGDAEILDSLARAGIAHPSCPIADPWRDRDVRRMLDADDFQALVGARAASAREILSRYLEQLGFFSHPRVALVDIGWNGTIQNNLQRAFGERRDWPTVSGLYFGLVDDSWQQMDPTLSARKEGLVADWRRPIGLGEHSPFQFLEIFEHASRALHGTTIGYEETAGIVRPRLQAEDASEGQDAVATMQRGILAFARSRSWTVDDATDEMRADVHRRLRRFIWRPRADELAAVAGLTHDDDWGSGRCRPLVVERPTVLGPRQWLRVYHAAPWKPGLLRATAGPLAARLYEVWASVRS